MGKRVEKKKKWKKKKKQKQKQKKKKKQKQKKMKNKEGTPEATFNFIAFRKLLYVRLESHTFSPKSHISFSLRR